jgi:hypothetical protein
LGKNAAEVFGSPGIINVFMVLSFRRDGVTTAYQSLRSSAALKTKFFGSIALAVPTAILAEDTRTGPVFNGDPAQSCEFRLYLRQYVLNKAVKYVLPVRTWARFSCERYCPFGPFPVSPVRLAGEEYAGW